MLCGYCTSGMLKLFFRFVCEMLKLISIFYYLFSGNDNFREKRRMKREKTKRNDNLLPKIVVSFWWRQQDSNL